MAFQVVLLVGDHPTYVQELMHTFDENSGVDCFPVNQLADLGEQLHQKIPDLVLLFAEHMDTTTGELQSLFQHLRHAMPEHRPIIVLHSDTTDVDSRIGYLNQGADDVLFGEIMIEEFRARLIAHLRRNIDFLCNTQTRLPGLQLSARILQRRMNQEDPWAMMAMSMDYFEDYAHIYGDIPGLQVLKTFQSMLFSVARYPDFIGHSDDHTFVLITHPSKASKIAALLCRRFDTVVPNFYSARDKKRGYLVSVQEDNVSRRVPFMTLSIGIVSDENTGYTTYPGAFAGASRMRDLARQTAGSCWLSEKPQLAGQTAGAPHPEAKTRVLVVESDAAMAYLLKSTLEMQNYVVESAATVPDAIQLLSEVEFRFVLMDPLIHGEPLGWELSEAIRRDYPDISIIMASTEHDRDRALKAGADLYLPKPFELVSLFLWMERLQKTA